MNADEKDEIATKCLDKVLKLMIKDLEPFTCRDGLYLELFYAVSQGLMKGVLITCNEHLPDSQIDSVRLEMREVINDCLKGDKNE